MADSPTNKTMKRYACLGYGGTDNFVETPRAQSPDEDQLLVHGLELAFRRGILEFAGGDHADWGLTFQLSSGYDVSGVVAAIGDGDTEWLESGRGGGRAT